MLHRKNLTTVAQNFSRIRRFVCFLVFFSGVNLMPMRWMAAYFCWACSRIFFFVMDVELTTSLTILSPGWICHFVTLVCCSQLPYVLSVTVMRCQRSPEMNSTGGDSCIIDMLSCCSRDWGHCLDDQPTDSEYRYPQVGRQPWDSINCPEMAILGEIMTILGAAPHGCVFHAVR